MNFVGISFTTIKNEIETFLKEEYGKASILFTAASPYGQILSVIENLHQLSLLYLKNTLSQFDLSNIDSINPRIIRNAAIFAGHNPTRSISASGTLRLSVKPEVDLDKEIPGGRIIIYNRSSIINKTNSYNYSINLGSEKVSYMVTKNYKFFLPIIQGTWIAKTYTGVGESLQTLFVTESGSKDIENFNVEVTVNGDIWTIKKHLYDMLPGENAVVVKSGFDGGIDIIFGNNNFGQIPPIASVIKVSYLKTDGFSGNIFRRTTNDWTILDNIYDSRGGIVDIEKIFNIDIHTDINFGANAESPQFTKSLLPFSSNNYVLATAKQYAYEIKKLGVFSHVNAYEKNGTIFITATPNINLFKNQSSNYFNIGLSAFVLDTYEKSKIDQYLKTGGTIQLTKKYKITNPKTSFYAVNIFYISYSNATDDSINSQIINVLSEYFLNLNRFDRIPKSEIIKNLSSISDINSIDIQFVSKKNEDYHREGKLLIQNSKNNTPIQGNDLNINSDYIPNKTLGLDPVLGDILFEPDEIPILRGGWLDRDGNLYNDDIDDKGLKPVNIFKRGTVDSKNKP